MKYILIAFVTCFGFNAFAQIPFEGKIIYKVISTEKKDSGYLTIFFGKTCIRLELVEAKNPEKNLEAIIVNLDSGKVFSLNPDDKKYKEIILKRKKFKTPPESRNIAGFTTTPRVLEFSQIRSLSAFLGEPVLHVADNLYYTIPEVYEGNLELEMIQKGKIVLGAEFYITEEESWPVNDTLVGKKKNIFNVFATEVVQQAIDPALFLIPADYTKRTYHDYSMDSTSAIFDTTAVYPADTLGLQQHQAPINKKKSPTKKKTTTKQNATRRKAD